MRQLPQPDPRGWLALQELPGDIRRAEDQTAAADLDRAEKYPHTVAWTRATSTDHGNVRCFTRPATDTERHLLAALGHPVPDDLTTFVHHTSRGVRLRLWPQLEIGEHHE